MMKKVIGIVLIVLALGLSYMGVQKVSNSGESVEVIGIELSASDEGKKTEGFMLLGLGVVAFFGGIVLLRQQ